MKACCDILASLPWDTPIVVPVGAGLSLEDPIFCHLYTYAVQRQKEILAWNQSNTWSKDQEAQRKLIDISNHFWVLKVWNLDFYDTPKLVIFDRSLSMLYEVVFVRTIPLPLSKYVVAKLINWVDVLSLPSSVFETRLLFTPSDHQCGHDSRRLAD